MRDESFLSANIQRIDAEAKHPQTHLTVSDKENHGMGFDGLEVLGSVEEPRCGMENMEERSKHRVSPTRVHLAECHFVCVPGCQTDEATLP